MLGSMLRHFGMCYGQYAMCVLIDCSMCKRSLTLSDERSTNFGIGQVPWSECAWRNKRLDVSSAWGGERVTIHIPGIPQGTSFSFMGNSQQRSAVEVDWLNGDGRYYFANTNEVLITLRYEHVAVTADQINPARNEVERVSFGFG